MRESLVETYRKHFRQSNLIGGMVGIIVAVLFLIVDIACEDVSIVRYLQKPKDINAGELLSLHHKQKVRCTFDNVMDYVVNYYHAADETKTIYTCGFIAADENYEHPFFVFVPPEKKAIMEVLEWNTWYEQNGEPGYGEYRSITVEGFVQKFNSENAISDCRKALAECYGESYANAVTNIYYIDVDGSVAGKDPLYFMWGILAVAGFFFFLGIVFIIRGFGNGGVRCIYDFVEKKGISVEQLEREFQLATELNTAYYISSQYTFGMGGLRNYVLKNSDIVWAYSDAKSHGRSVYYGVCIYTLDKEKHWITQMSSTETDCIVEYYSENFPHIVIGNDKSKRLMFQKSYEAFLKLRYWRERKKEEFVEEDLPPGWR